LQKGSSFLPYLQTILQLHCTIVQKYPAIHLFIIFTLDFAIVDSLEQITEKIKKLSRQSKQES